MDNSLAVPGVWVAKMKDPYIKLTSCISVLTVQKWFSNKKMYGQIKGLLYVINGQKATFANIEFLNSELTLPYI